MSQTKVLRVLKELGGEATMAEIRKELKNQHPNRTLHHHAHRRLKSLNKQNFVTKHKSKNRTKWKLSSKSHNKNMDDISLKEMCSTHNKTQLKQADIEIANIVSTIDLDTNIDLHQISKNIESFVYEPEVDSHANFHVDECGNLNIRVPSTGRITIAGATSKNDITQGLDYFLDSMGKIGLNLDYSEREIVVQNILAVTDIQKEVNLEEIANDTGQGVFEYNPKQFSGAIFRSNSRGIFIIYRTGKATLNGVRSYSQLLSLYDESKAALPINL